MESFEIGRLNANSPALKNWDTDAKAIAHPHFAVIPVYRLCISAQADMTHGARPVGRAQSVDKADALPGAEKPCKAGKQTGSQGRLHRRK